MTAEGGQGHKALHLSEVLREFRLQRELSRRALSQQAGLSPSYIGKLETGAVEPSVRSFAVIALALGLTSHEILFCVRCALAEVSSDAEEDNVQ